jgi:beta-galactosidase
MSQNIATHSIFIVTLFSFLLTTPFSSNLNATEQNESSKYLDTERTRTIRSFDNNWSFLKADAPGAEQPKFDDDKWRNINVPHDWSIEGPYNEQNPTGSGGGYLPSGISWYRKHFTLPKDWAQRHVFIEFDGVMANSDVWINGQHLGNRPNGYVSFRYELTDHLNFGNGKSNVLAVRTDTSLQPSSRWYTGQGIYRHVRLVAVNPVHIDHWGVYVTTPQVAAQGATVRIQTKVVNQSDQSCEVTLQTTIKGPDKQALQSANVTQTVSANGYVNFNQILVVNNPLLWSPDAPELYSAVSKLSAGSVTIDDEVTTFGIRKIEWKPATGFYLNGTNMKMFGVCLHHDAGGLGSAVPLRAWERRLERLKQIGVNAIRTSHNTVAPEFLDLIDRMGFLVMNETFDTWTSAKNNAENGYNIYFREWWEADTRNTVLRDRNHPCVVIYSAGNEIRDGFNRSLGWELFLAQRDLIHRLDPTRPVTLGVFRPNNNRVYDNGFAELMDIVGQNYRENELVRAYQDDPQRKVIGTENAHSQKTWQILRDNPFMSGQFLWTGIDYHGESDWPAVIYTSGLLDSTGSFRTPAYQRQSWWSDKPMVHIVRIEPAQTANRRDRDSNQRFSNWTPLNPDNYTNANVEVYSNCEEVELVLNGNSLGSKPKPSDDNPRIWKVPFEAGTIQALAKNKGELVATDELKTAGKPANIVLAADRTKLTNDWDDVSYVEVTVTDENGINCPWADDLITFSLNGPGLIAAVENGNPKSHESFQGSKRHLFEGTCNAIIKATASSGRITLTASAPGLKTSSITIEAAPPSTGK